MSSDIGQEKVADSADHNWPILQILDDMASAARNWNKSDELFVTQHVLTHALHAGPHLATWYI